MSDLSSLRKPRSRRPYGAPIVLAAALAVLASACAEDDPIGLFDENACEVRPDEGSGPPAADEASDHAGDADDHADESVVDFVVEMDMLEFGYSCTLPTLPAGTVLQLNMENVGAVEHEAVFGDLAVQEEAEAAMSTTEDGGHADHDTHSLVLAPGESGTIIVRLDDPGPMIVGCHVAGHWDAGMRSDFTVSA